MKNLITVFWALAFSLSMAAQRPKKTAPAKKQQLIREDIKKLNTELDNVRKYKSSTLSELAILEKKIQLREQSVENNRLQVNSIDEDIDKLESEITRLDVELKTLKAQYEKSIAYAYKNQGNHDFLNFVFSAANFNDALKRVEYLKSHRFYGEQQAIAISKTSSLLQNKISTLQAVRAERKKAFDDGQSELLTYTAEKLEKDELISILKTKEKQLTKEIAAKAKTDKALQKGIQVAVLNADTKEEEPVLAKDFENYKGKLPWPVDSPVVKIHFGKYGIPNTPVFNYNPGLTVETDAGAPVKAIFDGDVFSVFDIEGNTAVIISHGKYLTTYSNLTDVIVTKGQKIEKGQVLGKAAPNKDGSGEIEFVLLLQAEKQIVNINPEAWLKKQ